MAEKVSSTPLPNVITAEVVLLASRECQDIDAIRRVIGSPDQTVKISGSLKDMLEDVQLTPTEGFLLSRLDASQDVAGLIRLSSLPEDQTYITLYTLLLSGTVIVGDGDRDQPPAPVPVVEAEKPPQEIAEAPDPESTEEEFDFSERQLEERRYILKLSEDVTKVDHYRALDLNPSANPGEVKDAWEKIQNRFSAEKPVPHLRDMSAHLERIVERSRAAYEVLSVFRARTRYDDDPEIPGDGQQTDRRRGEGGGRCGGAQGVGGGQPQTRQRAHQGGRALPRDPSFSSRPAPSNHDPKS